MKLADDVYFIQGKNEGKFPHCNTLIVGNAAIDPNCGIEILNGFIERTEVAILSHNHPDHSALAWYFNSLNKEVFAPHPFTKVKELAERFALGIEEKWIEFATEYVGLRDFEAKLYNHFSEFEWSGHEIELIKTSGHTDDMHLFLIDGKILYSADIDLTEFGPWYGNPESDPYKFKESIESLFSYDFDVIVPSHSEPVHGRDEIETRLNSYIEHFDRRERLLKELYKRGLSIDEIVELSPIYRKKKSSLKEIMDYFEKNMIEKHLMGSGMRH